ncbi:hypothetical protein FE257_011174 [Aspergillus nanangensis]|uniref:N-acetyltransferase domain-containing protein n=1 Tax=Aspergillus nanangensis TaxID=2582783 RepID=A0AAD4GRL1_ASPNN|nr:hypothetical protein FE257_011174 [Aspergillus nanangensis]
MTHDFEQRLDRASCLLADAFQSDPSITYSLASVDPHRRNDSCRDLFRVFLHAAVSRNASIDETDECLSCGVLTPPKSKSQSPQPDKPGFKEMLFDAGLAPCLHELLDIPSQTKICKQKVFGEEDDYFYIFFVGTAESARGRRLGSAILKHYQGMARQAKLPIYLEAGTEYSRNLYNALGFVTVGEIVIGKGKAAPDGTLVANGPGFKMWGMIWRPE